MSKRVSNKNSTRVQPARSRVRLGWRKKLRAKILAEMKTSEAPV